MVEHVSQHVLQMLQSCNSRYGGIGIIIIIVVVVVVVVVDDDGDDDVVVVVSKVNGED